MIRLALRFAVLLVAVLVTATAARASDLQSVAAALKQGGYIIVFRHGATDESQKDI
jgi:hypothetical protein